MELEHQLVPGATQPGTITQLLHSKGLEIYTTRAIVESLCLVDPPRSLPAVASKLDDLTLFRAGGGTQISKIRSALGQYNSNVLIASLIFDLADYYNLKLGLSEAQVKTLVDLISIEFYYLKIEQVVRAFHLQKMGNGVKIYDRLDPATVIQVLRMYEHKHGYIYETDALQYKEEPVLDSERTSKKKDPESLKQELARSRYNQEGAGINPNAGIKPKTNG